MPEPILVRRLYILSLRFPAPASLRSNRTAGIIISYPKTHKDCMSKLIMQQFARQKAECVSSILEKDTGDIEPNRLRLVKPMLDQCPVSGSTISMTNMAMTI